MVSLLDNAAPGGLLADPRPAILAQLFDMSVKKRPTFLPMFTQQNGRIGLTAPQLLVDAVNSAMLPYAAAQGYRATPTDVSQMALDTMLGGGLLGRAPSGSLAVNVFHGTPHRFAPEPGFPYGRPRLDKMGTGEGAQAYGPGFYSAESDLVGGRYRNVGKVDRGEFEKVGMTESEVRHAHNIAKEYLPQESDAAAKAWGQWLGKEVTPEIKSAFKNASGGEGILYKLDIPDADAAKTLDWDAPLAKQPKPIRDAYSKAMLGDEVFKDPILKELFADGVPNQHLGLLENSSGAQAFNTLAGKLGSQQAAADALREAGIPGVKYLDQGSRGAGEGTRNYAIWDQDVLDRTKMLERDGVTLGANKSPTAATAGLLSRSPLEEKTAGVIVETSKRGDVLEISKIETPKGSRGQGLAQSKLDEIIAQADRDGVTLALTPSNAFGASKKRLTDWYRRNGFVPNKGQNKNFATRESMVRPPTVPVGNRGLLD